MTVDIPVAELPKRLQIESTAKCNFRCGSCMHSFEGYSRRNLGHLTQDRFRHVLDQLPGLEELELQGVGEPFLNPEVPAMIQDASLRGVLVHTFTNGSVLSESIAEKIIEARLHSMTFSIDGARKDTFETLRPGGRFEDVVKNIRGVVEAKKRLGSVHPYLNFNTVVSRRNVDELGEILELAESLEGIRGVTFVKLNTLIAPEWKELRLSDEEVSSALDKLKQEYSGEIEIKTYFDPMTTEQRKACWWPQKWVYISVEGYVTPCCNYHEPEKFNLGNVFVTPLREIWHGWQYAKFRKNLADGEFRYQCAAC